MPLRHSFETAVATLLCRDRLDAFSGGLVDALMIVPGIVVAGGSVVGALCDGVSGHSVTAV